MSLGGRCSPVCPNRHKARLFLFAQLLHARRANVLKGYWFACVRASAALVSRTEVPAKNEWNRSRHVRSFRITFRRSRLERGRASALTTKDCSRENLIWLAREKAREFILLSLLAASSLLLSK